MKEKEQDNYFINSGWKAADVILSSSEMISLAKTFGIPLGFGDMTIGQVCTHHGVPENLFLALCNMHKYADYVPDHTRLDKKDVPCIIQFLESSHSYYRDEVLPMLHSEVHKIAELCSSETKTLVNRFFDDYDEEMKRHIDNEEENEFKYIKDLITGNASDNLTIESFCEQHDDAETKIEDFKNIIAKYVPEQCNIPERYSAVIRILHIEKQLWFHTRIEENLLFPLVKRIEKERGQL